MGHCVTGLIAAHSALAAFASAHSLHSPVVLNASFAILPLRDDDIDSLLTGPLTGYVDSFEYLSELLIRAIEAASFRGPIMYFETEYFGGAGSQGAVVFRDGAIVFGPTRAEIGPINESLRLLGVGVVHPARDEFETIGLGRHRHTSDWLKDQTE